MGSVLFASSAKSIPHRGPKRRARDLVVQPDQWFVNLTQHGIQATVLGTGPSVFAPSPEEHTTAARIAKSNLTFVMRRRLESNMCPPPPGHVRVQFFVSLDMIRRWGQRPTLQADLPLEPTGELDLRRVRELWGLETCVPVDPVRWKVFEPVSDRISPLAVVALSEHYNALRFIEPAVSQSTHIKRRIRAAIVPRLIAFYIFLNNHTSLLVWYSAAQRQRNIFEWRLQRWASEHEELGRMMVALFILAVVLFLVSVMEGYVDLESTERVGRWMGMRHG